jgi:L-ascorbate metabolism protein UlaG (beta-lactamase superfamily)
MIERGPEGPPGGARLAVTRIANACVLLELGEAVILTDPWFSRHWMDVFLGPVNGMRLLGHRLVTDARQAVEAAEILGAKILIPIHDAHRGLAPLAWPTSSAQDAVRSAGALRVCCLPPGRRWQLP